MLTNGSQDQMSTSLIANELMKKKRTKNSFRSRSLDRSKDAVPKINTEVTKDNKK